MSTIPKREADSPWSSPPRKRIRHTDNPVLSDSAQSEFDNKTKKLFKHFDATNISLAAYILTGMVDLNYGLGFDLLFLFPSACKDFLRDNPDVHEALIHAHLKGSYKEFINLGKLTVSWLGSLITPLISDVLQKPRVVLAPSVFLTSYHW